MRPATWRRLWPLAIVSISLAACSGDGDDEQALVDVPDTVALGVVPQPQTTSQPLPTPPPPPTSTAAPDTTVASATDSGDGSDVGEPLQGPLGRLVTGDRVLMVGDSLLASAAPRNGGLMCDALTVFGWETEIDAEADHDIQFINEVLDERLDEDGDGDTADNWDIVVFAIGSEIDGTDAEALAELESELDTAIERVAPRPVVLVTLPGDDDGRAAINEMLRARPDRHADIAVLDFAELGGTDTPLQADDGLTFTVDGSKRLSLYVADLLGEAPDDDEGQCLGTLYDL